MVIENNNASFEYKNKININKLIFMLLWGLAGGSQLYGAAPTGLDFNQIWATAPKETKKNILFALGKSMEDKPPKTFIRLISDIPGNLNEFFGSWSRISLLAASTAALVGAVCLGYELFATDGPETISARSIERRMRSAVKNIKKGIGRKNEAPLRQISDALKGLLELRSVLNDALCGLPEKYTDMSFLQECCDHVDTLINSSDIAYAYRYVAQRDKTLQALITNLHDSAQAKISFEHLAGLQRSIQGKPVSTLGNIAQTIQWIRNGFDPVSAATDSGKVAAGVMFQTARDGLQALVGYPIALEKREDQIKFLQKIRLSLFSTPGILISWFEKLVNVTQVPQFLEIYTKKINTDFPFHNMHKKDGSAGSPANKQPVSESFQTQTVVSEEHLTKNTDTASPRHTRSFYKQILSSVANTMKEHRLITNIAVGTGVCTVVALAIRNHKVIGNAISTTAQSLYQRSKAAGMHCLKLLRLRTATA